MLGVVKEIPLHIIREQKNTKTILYAHDTHTLDGLSTY